MLPNNTVEDAVDVAVVGAGLAGLTCAQALSRRGYRTVVLEKSRGVGGRLATRRVDAIPIDHGVRYLESQGPQTQRLIQQMHAEGTVDLATAAVHGSARSVLPQPVYVSPLGMTAIAKTLAADLSLHRGHRVEALEPRSHHWCLQVRAAEQHYAAQARAVVLALPAPQVLPLLQPLKASALAHEAIAHLIDATAAVIFDPCFSVMVGYPTAIEPTGPLGLLSPVAGLSWIGFESQKRDMSYPMVVLQSSVEFAQRAIDALESADIANRLVQAAQSIPLVAALGTPGWTQVHRWRYAFCRRPHPAPCLSLQAPLPLACCGDWCGGSTVEQAMHSGRAASEAIAMVLAP